MIIIGKYKDIEVPKIVANVSAGGDVRMVLRNPDGSIAQDTGWMPNLITNHGLGYISGQEGVLWNSYMHIGSGVFDTAYNQAKLTNWLAVQNSNEGTTSVQPTGPNYEWSQTTQRRFNAGVGTGTITEFGMSYLNSSNPNQVIRSEVSPPVVKAANQSLDVYYRYQIWPNSNDISGTVDIGGITYNYTGRHADVGSDGKRAFVQFIPDLSTTAHAAHEGNISADWTGVPTGTSDLPSSITITADGWVDTGNPATDYGYVRYETLYDLNDANFAGGIRSILSRSNLRTGGDKFGIQIEFDNPAGNLAIPKTATDRLTIELEMRMTRRP